MQFNKDNIRAMLLTVWTPCAGKNDSTGSIHCTDKATQEILYVHPGVKRKLRVPVPGLKLEYNAVDKSVEGRYCSNCAKSRSEFLKNTQHDVNLEIREIPGIKEIIQFVEN